MMNTTIFQSLINGYNARSFTHNYIFGFTMNGVIYAVTTKNDVLPFVLCLDKASRGAGYALRFKPNKAQKTLLLAKGATVICSERFFNETVAASKYNKGEIFEKLVTEKFGQTWEKDNVPYTMGGDIEVNGIAYQIKFEKATFTNEKSLARM